MMANLETKSHRQPNAGVDQRGLRIAVVSAVGYGQTRLSAFDATLRRCGCHNYNLIPLSSVIPPAAEVVRCDRYDAPEAEYGHKLFVVKADVRSDVPGEVIAAGLGWLQESDGRGVFVEHEALATRGSGAALERSLAEQITASFCDLAAHRGLERTLEHVQLCVVSTRVTTQPACALVVAAYQTEGWRASHSEVGRVLS
jgi:arginine decarboxylase